MTNNLFVTFDVHDISRESSLILSAIEELGQAVRIFSCLWHVRSNLSAAEAAQRVWDVMEAKDRLLVIDASREEAAALNVDEHCMQLMMNRWHRDLADIVPLDPPRLAEALRSVEVVVTSTSAPARDKRAATG